MQLQKSMEPHESLPRKKLCHFDLGISIKLHHDQVELPRKKEKKRKGGCEVEENTHLWLFVIIYVKKLVTKAPPKQESPTPKATFSPSYSHHFFIPPFTFISLILSPFKKPSHFIHVQLVKLAYNEASGHNPCRPGT